MSTTNHTTNYELSQYIGTDVTSYLSNYNSDMYKIDAQMKVNADDAAEAKSDAATAVATSTTAASNASAAVSTANAANTTAEAAQTAATAAQTAAGSAQTTAEAALEASASNTIGNLAPAYDPTLTYAVGDLVTYVDPETNQGKLYKCIVAIVTPEAFNINKWDDVTTSEVYEQKMINIAEVNYTTADTKSSIYAELKSIAGSFDRTKKYVLKDVRANETLTLNLDTITTTGIVFSNIAFANSGTTYITGIAISSTPYEHINILNTDGTMSYINDTSNTFSVNGTLQLFESI